MNHMHRQTIVFNVTNQEYLLFIECIITVKSDFDCRVDVQLSFVLFFLLLSFRSVFSFSLCALFSLRCFSVCINIVSTGNGWYWPFFLPLLFLLLLSNICLWFLALNCGTIENVNQIKSNTRKCGTHKISAAGHLK